MLNMEMEEGDENVFLDDNSSIKQVKVASEMSQFSLYKAKVNWCVFSMICIFTLGSWLDISGLWCELPFMVDELPEGWRLPSILSAISQLAQLGPFTFLLLKVFCAKRVDNVKTIYVIFSIGACACFFLSIFWNRSVVIFNERRSVYLYVFNFGLSLLDGMSTLTFLPYIGEHFTKEYIIPNYIGESLSSLIPGLLAMAQGLETSDEHCKQTLPNTTNMSTTTTSMVNVNLHRPNFTVSVYFFLMFVLLLFSILAFTILNFSPVAMRERRKNRPDRGKGVTKPDKSLAAGELNLEEDDDIDLLPHGSTEDLLRNPHIEFEIPVETKQSRIERRVLLVFTFMVTFIYYGYLPGLLSYSTMPYAPKFFNLSMNLSNLFLPLSIIVSIWSYDVSLKRILLEASIPFAISVYIIAISLMSPCPYLVNNEYELGGYLIVVCWVVVSCMFMRIRCLIATRLEKHGRDILFVLGCFTILGQVIGGLLIFAQVEIYRVFQDKPKCASERLCYS